MNNNYSEILDRFKLPLGLGLAGLVLIIGGLVSSHTSAPKTFPKESLVSPSTIKTIKVDVSGAVQKPGVYDLLDSARVEDALKAAGGFSGNVNEEFVSKSLNLAAKLTDGAKIYIPRVGESVSSVVSMAAGSTAGGAGSGPVNINTASSAELEALPGIGAVTAGKIISGRPYGGVDDLINKKILGASVYQKVKASLTVN